VTAAVSAGILLFRRSELLELLLAHPGGPFWSGRDLGAWTIPKGLAERDEALLAVAMREFAEEVGFEIAAIAARPDEPPIQLGEIALKSGKIVHAWAVEGNLDPGAAQSNQATIEWPPRSGREMVIPEVDRVAWFDPPEARRRIHPAQAAFVDRLETELRA
jgi:predicted NUDIX family NTP pyrophosphohydrolase